MFGSIIQDFLGLSTGIQSLMGTQSFCKVFCGFIFLWPLDDQIFAKVELLSDIMMGLSPMILITSLDRVIVDQNPWNVLLCPIPNASRFCKDLIPDVQKKSVKSHLTKRKLDQ